MPFNITKKEDGGLIIDYVGLITSEENSKAHTDVIGEDIELFKKIPYVISDFTKAKNINHSSKEINKVAAMSRHKLRLNPNLLLAVIVPSTLFFALGRMWHVFLEEDSDRAELFKSLEEAENWVKTKINNSV